MPGPPSFGGISPEDYNHSGCHVSLSITTEMGDRRTDDKNSIVMSIVVMTIGVVTCVLIWSLGVNLMISMGLYRLEK